LPRVAQPISPRAIELNDVTFSLNYTQIATGLSLSNYATTSSLTSGLAGKLNLTGGTLTGGLVTAASASGGAGLNVPHGAAPSAPVNGDIWTTTTALSLRLNGATKTVAFTDSNITGSAATLTTGRTISTTGDVTYTSSSFNGSGNVTGTATIANSAVTLAKMANLAANSIIGNNTGSATAPIALTAAQVKTLLAVNFTDLSGTATAGQIPALDTAKITTGTFDAARIPNLDAAKITTGVFDVARIPILPSQTVQVSSGGIGDLTGGQQTNIEKGTVVTTTDGRRWVYNTGSKTSEASYVELADITPEWTSVANKPSFATVATSGSYDDLTNRPALATVATSGSYLDLTNRPSFATVATSGAYNDLTGKPTLGTMAAQNAASVAITGGTIDGVTLDGGTF
jgi:hypothetical protein